MKVIMDQSSIANRVKLEGSSNKMSSRRNSDERDLALALSPPGESKPLFVDVIEVYWTKDSYSYFLDLLASINSKDRKGAFRLIPVGSLRNQLHIAAPDLMSTAPHLALDDKIQYRKGEVLFGSLRNEKNTKELVIQCVESWIEKELADFIDNMDLPDNLRESAFALIDSNKLLSFKSKTVQLFPWQHGSDGALKVPNNGYSLAANFIAMALEGKDIFPELPGVFRVAGSDCNSAELISEVISTDRGDFSIVCRISIETIPAFDSPMVTINFSKRRWIEKLKSQYTRIRNKSAYLLERNGTRAFKFSMEKSASNDWNWKPDSGFSSLQQVFGVTHDAGEQFICKNGNKHFVGIAHDFESEADGMPKVGAGIPEKDRLDAFYRINEILTPLGFSEFNAFERLRNPIRGFSEITYLSKSLKKKAPKLLRDAEDSLWTSKDFPNELFETEKFTNSGETSLYLSQHVQRSFEPKEVKALFTNACIFVLAESSTEANKLKQIVRSIVGKNLLIETGIIPEGAHGDRSSLSDSKLKPLDRKNERMKSWARTVQSIENKSQNSMCLIQAPMFYSVNGKTKKDDEVNKPAAKLAFNSNASIPVQYILPPDDRESRDKSLKDYVQRVQQAVLDLVYGHHGIVPFLGSRAANYHEESEAPEHLYGVTIHTATKETRASYAELLVFSKVHIKSGVTEIKIAHVAKNKCITDWMPMTTANKYIASKSNSKLLLGADNKSKKDFVSETIQSFLKDVNKNSPNAYVLLHAEGCRRFWPRVTDQQAYSLSLDACREWPNIRIIRVRHQAPKIIREKVVNGIAVPTTIKGLLKIQSPLLPVYWSLGSPAQHYKRGLSCYRTVSLANEPDSENGSNTHAPNIKQTMRPNAVELSVLNCLPADNVDDVVSFVASLRSGLMPPRVDTWVKPPSPLFVLEKLGEYLKL